MTGNASAGATPVAGGATPPQNAGTPAPAPAPEPQPDPATGDDGLGDAGRRALRSEREARAAAERERDDFRRRLEELENASKSEHEKALSQAKREGATEVAVRYQEAIRRSEARAALVAAGLTPGVADLATYAAQFRELKVTDAGEVLGLTEAVDALRKSAPDLFAKTPAPRVPDYGGGARGAPADSTDMNAIIRRAAGRG